MTRKGLIIGRFQPLHKGHLQIFKEIEEDCDAIIIGVGSAQIEREMKNPLSGGERIKMIKKTLDNRNIGPYEIYPIPDIDCYPAWPYYVKSILPHFDCLYAYSNETLRLFEDTRTKIKRVEEYNKEKWSSTEVRRRIREGEKWKQLVPKEVSEFLEEINIKERLKPQIGVKSETEKEVAHLLTKKEKTIASAESCTGGLVSHRLTNIPGSSKYFERGLTTYSKKAKVDLLGVDEKLLKEKGAVNRETAKQMAEGIRKQANVDFGLSTTGVMGPGVGEEDESVGTVYIGLAHKDGTEVQSFSFSGNRWSSKEQTSEKALQMVIDFLKK